LKRNRPIFDARWGLAYDIAYAAFSVRDPLASVRHEWQRTAPTAPLSAIDFLFVLPNMLTAGGHLSVIQHFNEMILRNKRAGMLCFEQPGETGLPTLIQPIVMPEAEFRKQQRLPGDIIATMWTSASAVKEAASGSGSTGWYYVQDYEPWFYERSDQQAERDAAAASYELGLRMVAKTKFLCSVVEDRHKRTVHKVCPGIARDIFYPGSQRLYSGPPRLAALYRPDKPRRGTDLLLEVLEELLSRNQTLSIYLFGSPDVERCSPALRRRVHFLGRLTSNQVADLYRNCDVVCDFSLWHGFGRMGIEAMACGAVPVVTEAGGITEYARHGENALVVPDDPIQIAESVNHLLYNDVLRHQMRSEGLNSFVWSEKQATDDWLTLLSSTHRASKAA
jgi:hypothetical protein